MKKIILIIASFILLSAGATSYLLLRSSKKIGVVSENRTIPAFIEDFMYKERAKIFNRQADTSIETRLANLGFTKMGKVGFSDPNAIKAICALLTVYDSIYPQYQFINFACLANVLEKYNLSLGFANSFTNDVPLQAVKSMEGFKSSFLYARHGSQISEVNDGIKQTGETGDGFGNLMTYFVTTYGKITRGEGVLGPEKDLVKYSIKDIKERVGQTDLMVVAPEEYFNGEKNSAGVYGKATIKDPIVLAPVEGGYIIIAAW